MKKIILFNPGQASLNLGDEIIANACFDVINEIFKEKQILDISTHLPISNKYLKNVNNPDYKFVLGSNLLMSNMCGRFRQWDITLFNKSVLKDTILLGVGWNQYSKNANIYTKLLYNSIISKNYMHSVRDSYTKKKLEQIGIKNVINTGCPTLWKLTNEHCSNIPIKKAENVVCTLTDYNKEYDKDKQLLEILKKNYKKVYFWPQRIR